MPVFFRDGRRVLFIHVPKCGGSYVEALFRANGFGVAYRDTGSKPGKLNEVRQCSPQHMHAPILETLFRIEAFDYVFAVVRNPTSRLVSEFRMRHRERSLEANIDRWVKNTLSTYRRNPFVYDNHVRPQHEFIVSGCQVFRLEDGLGDGFLAAISEGAGLEFQTREMEKQLVGDSLSGVEFDQWSCRLKACMQ